MSSILTLFLTISKLLLRLASNAIMPDTEAHTSGEIASI